MKKEKNLVSVEVTDKQLDRYLDSLGLLHVFEIEYVSNITNQVFGKMQELFDTNYPEILPAKIKPSSTYFFKNKEEFDKQFVHYMKKVLLHEYLQMQVTHPSWSADKISAKIKEDHVSIFNRTITRVYMDVKESIMSYKIDLGQQPFGDELFSE